MYQCVFRFKVQYISEYTYILTETIQKIPHISDRPDYPLFTMCGMYCFGMFQACDRSIRCSSSALSRA